MPLKYHEKWCQHDDSVDCLSFSPDGLYLASISMDGTMNKLETIGFHVHDNLVKHLVFDHSGTWLATGGKHELKIWKYIARGCLLATYLQQGVIRWDVNNSVIRWMIPLQTLIGHADISPEEMCIAIPNQLDGVDVYQIPTAILLFSLKYNLSQDRKSIHGPYTSDTV
ncbi:hypothetical protein SERLA73DRAFT_150334 [Serpula lacrymans var. lacrymans S7.3]|uniref:Uncharacterized protein n=2 Tax=Serpula lacrymans var. lacrymans TaxID=341189 RepID=F8PM51_SERL3|nr:uncharacterized protein SERLADRAFT_405944 [Serpula lacrymans var. lacrymans S7.9]EGO02683.1 hypothetical protein SERLA73DRAFT_150334 [Serpula lacrymans var. lacrymans S7.3]EGO28383.1 hypothetical protein SERLADRAFT_405944 [Serpula lacrymans var. lacrymans S7.9]